MVIWWVARTAEGLGCCGSSANVFLHTDAEIEEGGPVFLQLLRRLYWAWGSPWGPECSGWAIIKHSLSSPTGCRVSDPIANKQAEIEIQQKLVCFVFEWKEFNGLWAFHSLPLHLGFCFPTLRGSLCRRESKQISRCLYGVWEIVFGGLLSSD